MVGETWEKEIKIPSTYRNTRGTELEPGLAEDRVQHLPICHVRPVSLREHHQPLLYREVRSFIFPAQLQANKLIDWSIALL